MDKKRSYTCLLLPWYLLVDDGSLLSCSSGSTSPAVSACGRLWQAVAKAGGSLPVSQRFSRRVSFLHRTEAPGQRHSGNRTPPHQNASKPTSNAFQAPAHRQPCVCIFSSQARRFLPFVPPSPSTTAPAASPSQLYSLYLCFFPQSQPSSCPRRSAHHEGYV